MRRDGEDTPGVMARPPLLLAGFLGAGLLLDWALPLSVVPRFPRVCALPAGAALLAAGMGLAVWALGVMLRAGTNPDPHRAATALVEGGPFRFTRNPIYLGMVLFHAGAACLLQSGMALATLPGLAAVLHYGVILREEGYLERKFGEGYRRYRTRVRRWV